MEEPINKKGIILVFLGLLVIFLFVYKGLILSGDEYLNELNSFTANTQKQIQGGMKKMTNQSGKKDNSPLYSYNKDIYDVLQNLEDLKLVLGAMDHNLKRNDNLVIESLGKVINESQQNVNSTNNVAFNANQIKEIIDNIDHRKVNIEPILDSLNQIIDGLRTAVKNNS